MVTTPTHAHDETPLLAAILARPDDDAPRLVYADWLTERGDPRGPFIVDGCRLATLDERDPDWTALHARCARALARHRRAWNTPLLEALGISEDDPRAEDALVYRRGLVEQVRSPISDPEILAAAAARTPLRQVAVDAVADPEIARALSAVDLTGLALTHDPFETPFFDPDALVAYERLMRALDLSRIHTLAMGADRFPQAFVDVLPDVLPAGTVRDLHVPATLPKRGVDALAASGALRALESLVAAPGGVGALRKLLSAAPGLKRLGISDPEPLWGKLPGVFGRRRFEALEVVGGVDDPLIEWLVDAGGAATIRRLRADPAPWDLARLLGEGDWSQLTRLDLSVDPYPDEGDELGPSPYGAEDIAPLVGRECFGGLVELRLRGTGIGDDGVAALVEAPHLTRLVTLDLADCAIGDDGAQRLAAWPGLANVVTLHLEGNGIGPAGFRALLASSAFDPARLVVSAARSSRDVLALCERFGDAVSFR